ncbi:MAG: DUF503 domain-containing protein [Candidatus Nanopelagicales bacterium]
MFVGILELDLLLPSDVHSLKAKRSYVKRLLADLRKFEVAAAEVGDQELHRRTLIGVAAVVADQTHVRQVLEACERLAAARPEFELLSARTRYVGGDD